MSRINATNERFKRDYIRFLKNARGKSETTIDAALKAIARFEEYSRGRDFKTFRRDQAIGFKQKLAETEAVRSGERLSYSTQAATMAALREFFGWLACQPGFKSENPFAGRGIFQLDTQRRGEGEGDQGPGFSEPRTSEVGDQVRAHGDCY